MKYAIYNKVDGNFLDSNGYIEFDAIKAKFYTNKIKAKNHLASLKNADYVIKTIAKENYNILMEAK